MKRVIKIAGWALLASAVLSVLLVLGTVTLLGALDPALIEINGERVDLAQFHVGHGLLAAGGLLLAGLIVLLVVPVAVLVPLVVVALVLVGLLLAFAGVVALVFSPLILLVGAGWLIWRLTRGARPKDPAKADATITG